MNQRDAIRMVWSRSGVERAGSGKNEAAPPPVQANPDQPSQRRAPTRCRTIWGREDGFTMSGARRLP